MRARSYDLERATTMWINHLAWQKEFSVPSILQVCFLMGCMVSWYHIGLDMYASSMEWYFLQEFIFNERDEFIAAWPQGYHKIDKEVRV